MDMKQDFFAPVGAFIGKLVQVLFVACVGVICLTGCNAQPSLAESNIVAQPVTDSEIISTKTDDAIAFAEQNTDSEYVDLTEQMLALAEQLNTEHVTLDEAPILEIIEHFQIEQPLDNHLKESMMCSLLNARISQSGYEESKISLSCFQQNDQLVIPAQQAANFAAGMVKVLFEEEITINETYLYYERALYTNDQRWMIYVKATTTAGVARTVAVHLDAISGELLSLIDYDSENREEITEEIVATTFPEDSLVVFETFEKLGLSVAENEDTRLIADPVIGHEGYLIGYKLENGDTYYARLSAENKTGYIVKADSWYMNGKGFSIAIVEPDAS